VKIIDKIKDIAEDVLDRFDAIFIDGDIDYKIVKSKNSITFISKKTSDKKFAPIIIPYGREIRYSIFLLIFIIAQ
jgi:hypothetical protein